MFDFLRWETYVNWYDMRCAELFKFITSYKLVQEHNIQHVVFPPAKGFVLVAIAKINGDLDSLPVILCYFWNVSYRDCARANHVRREMVHNILVTSVHERGCLRNYGFDFGVSYV